MYNAMMEVAKKNKERQLAEAAARKAAREAEAAAV
jgi:hypothetical protein